MCRHRAILLTPLLCAASLLGESPAERVAVCGKPRPTPAGQIDAVAASPDGLRIAAGASDGTLWMYDASTGKSVWKREHAHARGVLVLEFSRSGKLLASAACPPGSRSWGAQAGDGRAEPSVRLWDVSSGEPARELSFKDDVVSSIAFGSEDRTLIGGASDGTLSIVDLPGGHVVRTCQLQAWGASRLAVSPDGGRLAASSERGLVRVWDLANGSPLGFYREERGDRTPAIERLDAQGSLPGVRRGVGGGPCALAFTPDASALLTANPRGRLTLWDIEHGQPRWIAWRHQERVLDVGFAPDGKSAISLGRDGLRETNALDGLPLRDGATERDWRVGRVCPSMGGFVSARFQGPLVIEALDGEGPFPDLEGHCAPVTCAVFSPDGTTLASGDEEGRVCLWEASTGRAVLSRRLLRTTVRSLAITADGAFLAVGGDQAGIRVWDLSTDAALCDCEGLWEAVRWVGFDPARKRLFAMGASGLVTGWALSTLPPRSLLAEEIEASRTDPARPLPLGYMPTPAPGEVLVSGDAQGVVFAMETATGLSFRAEVHRGSPVRGVWWGDDGRVAISAGRDGRVCWTDLWTGELGATIDTSPNPIACLAVSPDGRLLALGRDDGTLDVWRTPEEAHREAPVAPKGGLDEAWGKLTSSESAWDAVVRLASTPDESIAFLESRILPYSPERFLQLAADLDADEVAVREVATESFTAFRLDAAAELNSLARTTRSPEVRERVRMILEDVDAGDFDELELRHRRAVVALAWMGTPAARRLLDRIAAGDDARPAVREARIVLRRLEPPSRPPEPEDDTEAQAW